MVRGSVADLPIAGLPLESRAVLAGLVPVIHAPPPPHLDADVHEKLGAMRLP
jgi:hypothetical protein